MQKIRSSTGPKAAERWRELGTEHTSLVLDAGRLVTFEIMHGSWNPNCKGSGEGVDGEEAVGVHTDDSSERFGCEGKVKNSKVVGDG